MMSQSEISIARQLDRICDQFEEDWTPDQSRNLSSWLAGVAETHHSVLLEMLLAIDVDMRQLAGHEVLPEDYSGKDDEAARIVARLLGERSREVAATASHPDAQPAKITLRLGPYQLLQKLGEGGMGTVWLAEQKKPLRRQVAIKVIKSGMDSKEVIARFEAERQALAMMDHQNIARVLDAGVTEDGRPFFAMELVQGKPVTEYCDENRLNPGERLELFVAVCNAIQHAHQKGIIHRDIKPSNVLVTQYEGKAIPKVIDFGLAKALQTQVHLTDKTLFTRFGQIVGTLQYMSPEQAGLNTLDIDTRTDVYSLGVLLYELLTGSTPLSTDTLKEGAMLKVLQTIREQEPPRPSTRLSDSGETIIGISDKRRIAPARLQQALRGELDWVVMKALEKDRNRRYETAVAFADDVNRYLNREAVHARPPSTTYKLKKLFGRNRGLVAGASTILLLLVAGIAGVSIYAAKADAARIRAENEEIRANQKTEEANERAEEARQRFELALNAISRFHENTSEDVILKQPELLELRTRLLASARAFYQELIDETDQSALTPGAACRLAEMISRLAEINADLGDWDAAHNSYKDAIRIAEEAIPEIEPERDQIQANHLLANYLTNLGMFLGSLGRNGEARELLIRAKILRENNLGNHQQDRYRIDYSTTLTNLASVELSLGRLDLALATYAEVRQLNSELFEENPDAPDIRLSFAASCVNLGMILVKYGENHAAIQEYLRAIELLESGEPGNVSNPDALRSLAAAQNNLGNLYVATDQNEEALKALQSSLRHRTRLADAYPNVLIYRSGVARGHHNLGNYYGSVRDEENMRQAMQSAVKMRVKLANDFPDNLTYLKDAANTLGSFGNHLREFNKFEHAKREYLQAETYWREVLQHSGEDIEALTELGGTLFNIGNVHTTTAGVEKALDYYAQAEQQLNKCLEIDTDNRDAKQYLTNLMAGRSQLFYRQNRFSESAVCWQATYDLSGNFLHGIYAAQAFANSGNHKNAYQLVLTLFDRHDVSKDPRIAFVLAACVDSVETNLDPSDPAQSRLIELYGSRAVQVLADAKSDEVFKASVNTKEFWQSEHLLPLHDREDFRSLAEQFDDDSGED